jgi:hypothetical protein
MRARFACAGALLLLCWLGRARAATLDEAMQEARSLLAQAGANAKLDEDRSIALALKLAGGCPATIDGDLDTAARKERKRTIDALIATDLGIPARNRLAREISVFASDRDMGTREAVALALGKIAAPSARPVLRRLLDDGERTGTVCTKSSEETRAHCHPLYPVREAARRALDHMNEIEQNYRGSTKMTSIRVGTGGMPCS